MNQESSMDDLTPRSNPVETTVSMISEGKQILNNTAAKGKAWGRTWVRVYKVFSALVAIGSGGGIIYGVVKKQDPVIIIASIECAFGLASSYLAHQFEKLLPLNQITKKLEKDDELLEKDVTVLDIDDKSMKNQIQILVQENELQLKENIKLKHENTNFSEKIKTLEQQELELNNQINLLQEEKKKLIEEIRLLKEEISKLEQENKQFDQENKQLLQISKKIELNVGDLLNGETRMGVLEQQLKQTQQKEEELFKRQQQLVSELEQSKQAKMFMEVIKTKYSTTYKNAMEMYMQNK